MNRSALKKFAIEARRELIEKVELQARKLGITAEAIQEVSVESSDAVFIEGRQLSGTERKQRNKLITRINDIGFDRVIEETAYTWFNRFVALRFMEVNEYLPTKVRVLSSNSDSTEPDMIKEALSLNLNLDKDYLYDLKLNNKTDELFKYLIKMHCNDLNRYMPFMFETIEDYSEILFPEGLLGTDSFLRQMINIQVIPEKDWKKVEIIGWLYQYYISEENERVIQAKKRYKAEEIPFATQLFTPEWIVRYMVQNALGRYWIESHPEHRGLIENWEFYIENSNLEESFQEKLAPYINKELNVEDIKCFDPAMGSGHILVYMFDILYEIYSKCGYMQREIPRLIIENNLYGLDIDDRAHQLASFSVVMKALQYNKRFLRSIERDSLTINLASIQETNTWSDEEVVFLAGESSGKQFNEMKIFIDQFKYAKAIGSLIKLKSYDIIFLKLRLEEIKNKTGDLFEMEMKDRILKHFERLIKQVEIMNMKYDVLITNPPYAGNKYLTSEVSTYLTNHYPDSKSDLFSSFMEYSFKITKNNGQIGMITPFVWMFISSFEKIRKKVVIEKNISSLVQLEYNSFEAAVVPISIFTLRNYKIDFSGEYIKLSDFKGIDIQPIKTLEAIKYPNVNYRFTANHNKFLGIPGFRIGYWASENVLSNFENGNSLHEKGEAKQGLATGDNNQFLRNWFEVDFQKIGFNYVDIEQTISGSHKWFPCNKGGSFQKWYGNNQYIVNWEKNGREIRSFYDSNGKLRSRPQNLKYYFMEGLTWSSLSSSSLSVRYSPPGFIFETKGSMYFPKEENEKYYILGFLNSKVTDQLISMISPTLDYHEGPISSLPIIVKDSKIVEEKVKSNINITKKNVDSFEISWDFLEHPFMGLIDNKKKIKITDLFLDWEVAIVEDFEQLKRTEEEINQIFINIYGLEDELSTTVMNKDISIRKNDFETEIKNFISYAVGCSLGRYSLDKNGLIHAGGEFNMSQYKIFPADEDNIIPILSGAYFEDDIVTKIVDFVRITLSEETLEENLDFIAAAIGRRKNETSRETLRRYFLNNFYKDHVQTYKKRPIYWLFTSGKEKAFNCLIYMHRYDKTTLSRIRTDYLHEVQIRLDAEKKDLLDVIEGDSTTKEMSNAKKELKSLDKKIDELKAYDELLHHMADMQIEIDLDDGVKVNYEKFKGLVAKI
nr:BREX-1 system adenine-specific DNA-methyltransferase PglX [Exiguobacterium sp. s166]